LRKGRGSFGRRLSIAVIGMLPIVGVVMKKILAAARELGLERLADSRSRRRATRTCARRGDRRAAWR